jgi:DNA-directed RNA polymerase specialized sigma24 family protein
MSAVATGLEQIYLAHRAELLRFLVAWTGDPAEAEDVLQGLWLSLAVPRRDRSPMAAPIFIAWRKTWCSTGSAKNVSGAPPAMPSGRLTRQGRGLC